MNYLNWLSPIELVFYLLAMAAIVMLSVLSNARISKGLYSRSFQKIGWGLLGVAVGYWVITFPASLRYEPYSGQRLVLQADLESRSPETKYIHNHHYRIEELEIEVRQARNEVQALNKHYRIVLQLLLAGILIYSVVQVLLPRRIDDSVRLNLGKD